MAPGRSSKDSRNMTKKPPPPGKRSMDQDRHVEDARHHDACSLPHPPHRVLRHTTGLSRHHPHTRPSDFELDIDHGTHEDRPRPGKLAKKGSHGKKERR